MVGLRSKPPKGEAMATATHNETDALLTRVLSSLHGVNPQAAANLEYDLAQDEDRIMRQFTVETRKDGLIQFTSDLTDSEVLQSLRAQRSQFAQDLAAKFNRLSVAQYSWAHKLATDHNSRQQNVETDKVDSTFETLVGMLSAVKGRSKTIKLSDDISLHLSRCKAKVWVKNPSKSVPDGYGNHGPQFLGTIGAWGLSTKLPEEVREQIIAFAG